MKTLMATLVTLVSIVLFVGCSGGSGSGVPSADGGGPTTAAGSCNGGLESGCTQELCCQDYRGNFTAASARTSCAAIAGTYSTEPCRTDNRVGSCVLYQNTAAEQIVRYYAGYTFLSSPSGAESVAANCAALHIGTYLPE